jgi:pimeloyl-ACP methyl ester carboxylesterase
MSTAMPPHRQPANLCFLHGLESSSRGTKGRWLAERFPDVRLHDYHGDLPQRLEQLEQHLTRLDDLILVGSSFGGLMAACFAARHPGRCRRLVLLAPALNFAGYRPPPAPLDVETLVVLGTHDTVCPPDLVLPLARASFLAPEIRLEDDDHLLHRVFPLLDWRTLLA